MTHYVQSRDSFLAQNKCSDYAHDILHTIPGEAPEANITLSSGGCMMRVQWPDSGVSLLVGCTTKVTQGLAPNVGYVILQTTRQVENFVRRSVVSTDPREAELLRLETSLRNSDRIEDRIAAVNHAAAALTAPVAPRTHD